LNKIGRKLIADAKAAAMHSNEREDTSTGTTKDLLSLLVRANLASDGQKLSDGEVIARKLSDQLFGVGRCKLLIEVSAS
jgi:hypothetical protein